MYSESSVPLYKLAGVKEGWNIKLINEPESYRESFNGIKNKLIFHSILKEPVDLIHLFTKSKKELIVELPYLVKFINDGGSMLVSWPKETANFISDLNVETVRAIGNRSGLIGTELYSIDEQWFAQKFVNGNLETK